MTGLRRYLLLAWCALAGSGAWAHGAGAPEAADGVHVSPESAGTTWRVRTNLAFDACSAINWLCGDEWYMTWHRPSYERWRGHITPRAAQALERIRASIKGSGGIISAKLTLYFSGDPSIRDIDGLLGALDDPSVMEAGLRASPYFDEASWERFLALRDDLRTVFAWMRESGFERDWVERIRPHLEARCERFAADLAPLDPLTHTRRMLGMEPPSDTIDVEVLAFAKPHGIRIIGSRFITDVSWPVVITARTATHEMMHPPYMAAGDDALLAAIESFRDDAFVMHKVENHNPAFGYNDLAGFVEENCVQALDQVINERLGIAKDPRTRWIEADDGMHVLAVALYQALKTDQEYPERGETFRDFFVRIVAGGTVGAGTIRAWHERFYGDPADEHDGD